MNMIKLCSFHQEKRWLISWDLRFIIKLPELSRVVVTPKWSSTQGGMIDGDSSHMEYLSLHKHVGLISSDGLDSNCIYNFWKHNCTCCAISQCPECVPVYEKDYYVLSWREGFVVKHIHLSSNWQKAVFYCRKKFRWPPNTCEVSKWSNSVK